jgi:hypothetical protein
MRDRSDICWQRVGSGFALVLGSSRKSGLSVIPDERSGLWRVAFRGGFRSDIVNFSRARDAACTFALIAHRARAGGKCPLAASPMRSQGSEVPGEVAR